MARAGTAASRISTTRDCFSSITDTAICWPNVTEAMKNTSPKPKDMRYRSAGFGAAGSSSSTPGRVDSACTRSEGASVMARTLTPAGLSGSGTTAASAAPESTASRAASSEPTVCGA